MKNPFLGGDSVVAAVSNLDAKYQDGDIGRKTYTAKVKAINNSFGTKFKPIAR